MVEGGKQPPGSNIASDLRSIFAVLRTRRTKVFAYGFIFSFVTCTAFIAFFPSTGIVPFGGSGSPWLNNFFASASVATAPYRSQLSSLISRFFPNSTGEHPLASNSSAATVSPPSGGAHRQDGVLGKNLTGGAFRSSPDGVSVKNQTSSSAGSPQNAIVGWNQTSSAFGFPQNVTLGKNQTKPGAVESEVLAKNQTISGLPDKNKTGTNVTNSSPSRLGKFPAKDQTDGTAGTTKKEAPASNPPKGASGSAKNETLGSSPSPSPSPSQKNAQGPILAGNQVSNLSASLAKGNQSSPSSYTTPPEAPNIDPKSREWSVEAMEKCDIFDGRWVRDDHYPLYPEGSCPHIDEPFNCFLNGRPDRGFEKHRWQPDGCNIPRLNATDMLERLRGKRLVFVGDSLNRNMWESLVCVLRNSVKDKKKVFEASGRHEFRTEGSYSFLFKDYGCTVEFFRSPFLVQEWEMPDTNGKKKETLRLDIIERSSSKYKTADIIVFNTGHWWTHDKTSKGKDYYQEGNRVYSELNVVEAFHKALNTWAKWVDANVDPKKTIVFFRGYSASHFSGGQWNSGGQCDSETEPIKDDKYLKPYPPKMRVLESVLKGMKTPVAYLNITRMTDYRKDAHPSIYRKPNLSEEERRSPDRYQDCSHWCLPGVPDSWNELLYAQLLIKQHRLQ